MSIVFTNGCFDVLHRGHVEYLKASKKLGDWLIVGLNSDESVSRRKGKSRPVNNQEDRKFMLESLKFVDQVVIFHEDTPEVLISRISPDIVTKGGDYTVEEVRRDAPSAKIVILPLKDGYSTTKTLEKLKCE